MLDLIVVGGGPAGLLTATRCAEAGLNVLVLEEHLEVGAPTHCTGIVSLEVTELAKVPDEIVLSRLTRARLFAPGGSRSGIELEAPGSDPILTIDRRGFDQGLAEQTRRAGAVIETGMRVTDVVQEPSGVGVAVGDGRRLGARACVLACGVSYRFQRKLGLGLPGSVAHTAQVEVLSNALDAVEIWFGRRVAPEGFLWVVPVARPEGDCAKVGVMGRGDAGEHLRRFLASPAAGPRLGLPSGPPVRRLLPLQTIRRTFADRMLVVGDAGGFTKPTTGGGIFYSLLSASLAAEVLVEGFQSGRLDSAFLSAYERRWESRLGPELKLAAWLRQVLARATDAEIRLLLEAAAADDVRALIGHTARFNWHGDLIRSAVRHPRIAVLLLRLLLR
jgi:geranylgeranyl reductase family protein